MEEQGGRGEEQEGSGEEQGDRGRGGEDTNGSEAFEP